MKAPASRGRPLACMCETSGPATAAMIVPATTGVTIVEISPSSQIAPMSTAPTPTRNQGEQPQVAKPGRGLGTSAESSPALSSSTGPSADACDGFGFVVRPMASWDLHWGAARSAPWHRD